MGGADRGAAVLGCAGLIVPLPTGVVAKTALDLRLTCQRKRKEYESAWSRLVSWMEDARQCLLTPAVLDEYICRVCIGGSSEYLAKVTRAAAVWVCELERCALPCDRVTWKLVKGLERRSALGVRAVLDEDQVLMVLGYANVKVKWVVSLGMAVGARASEMVSSCLEGYDPARQVFRTKWSKFAELGRDIDAAPMVGECVEKLKQFVSPGQPFYGSREELLADFRAMMAVDPGKIPPISLMVVRRWTCTHLWSLGVSSSWLMQFMHHTSWMCTKRYIMAGGVPKWRDKPDLVEHGTRWLPRSAGQAPVVSHPGKLAVEVARKRKRDYIQVVEKAKDLGDSDMPTTSATEDEEVQGRRK